MSGKAGITSLIALGLLASTSAYAEEFNLDEVVVSAGLVPVDEEKVGRAYTVVTGKQLEQSQTKYVADALRSVPGVTVNRTGSYGGKTSIMIRGAKGGHVLVLVDGVEISATSDGSYDFGGFQVADIDRIEVLRGPQSSLYGSDAMAGVIQIVTKKGRRDADSVHGQLETGTDGTALVNLGISGGREKFDYAFSGAFRRTNGFNVSDEGSEDDGDRNVTLNGKVNLDLTENLKFGASARYVDRDSDTDDQDWGTALATDTANSYIKTKEFSGRADLIWSLFDGQFVQKVTGAYTSNEKRGVADSDQYGDDGDRAKLSYQGTVFFDTADFANAKHSLTGAVDWEHETYKNPFGTSPLLCEEKERDMFGFVAEYKGEFWDHLFLSSAIRLDQNDDFEDSLTYSTSAAYEISRTSSRLHASFGTGSKNPSFNQQFGSSTMYLGNPNLKAETSIGWDVGISQALFNDRFSVDLTYFNQRFEDQIASRGSTYVNLDGTTQSHGLEVSVDVEITDNLHLNASYTLLDQDDNDANGSFLSRRPKHSGSINVTQSLLDGKAHVFVDAIINGERTDTSVWTLDKGTGKWSATKVSLADYALVNVGADYQINDHAQIYGRVENLLDADYQEVYGYNTAGITGYVGLKADF